MISTFDARLPHDITLSCRSATGAKGKPRVLLLHGFPEAAWVWDETLLSLADAAHGIAPSLRGYAPSSAPAPLEDYRAKHLVADLEALITQLGAPMDLVVAHDWGGALAWNLAALRPDLMRRLLIINAPHPATFLRELRDSPAQQQASAYMNFLCRPDAQALLAEGDFARLWPFFENMGGTRWLTPALRERYRQTWLQGLDGPLNYYRASPLRPPGSTARAGRAPSGDQPADTKSNEMPDESLAKLNLPPAMLRVTVPTTVLWGLRDTALLPSLLDGLDNWVAPLEVITVADASHWIIHEQPELVQRHIRRLLNA
jgi:pimeloyl-ACP methyl ester carboxylesterase